MGLLAKFGGLASFGASFIPGVGGLAAKAITALTAHPLAAVGGAGAVGAAAGAGTALALTGGGGGGPPGMMRRVCVIGPDGHKYAMSKPRPASPGGRWYRCRPRGRGISARDIRGAQKVARVVHAFGWKPKMHKRKGRR